jgi:hypothetical protein
MLLEESPVTPYPSSSAEVPNCFVQCFSVFAISSEQPKANVGQKVGLSFKLEGLHGFDDKDQRIKYV